MTTRSQGSKRIQGVILVLAAWLGACTGEIGRGAEGRSQAQSLTRAERPAIDAALGTAGTVDVEPAVSALDTPATPALATYLTAGSGDSVQPEGNWADPDPAQGDVLDVDSAPEEPGSPTGAQEVGAMMAPSFEEPAADVWRSPTGDAFDIAATLEADVPHPTRCTRASSVDYNVADDDGRFASLPAADGAWLALCTGDGELMRAELNIPAEASELVVDAGAVDFRSGHCGGGLQLALENADGESLPLTPVAEMVADGEPAFMPHRVALEEVEQPVYLVVQYASPRFEEGSLAGAVYLDNVRFE